MMGDDKEKYEKSKDEEQEDHILQRQRRSKEEIAEKRARAIDQKEKEEVETNQRVMFNYIELDPKLLKPHPINKTLYGDEQVDKSLETLIESIQKQGQLDPIIITSDYTIISGHRRWRALMQINTRKKRRKEVRGLEDFKQNYAPAASCFTKVKAKCQKVTFRYEWEEQLAIIEYNKRREKRYSQTYNEIEMLHDILDPDSIRRRNMNLWKGSVPPNSEERDYPGFSIEEQREEIKSINKQIENEYKENETEDEKIAFDIETHEVRRRIADILGMGKDKVWKLEKVGRLAKTGDEVAVKTMKCLDAGTLTINGSDIVRRLEETFREGRQGAAWARELIYQIFQGTESKSKKGVVTPKKALDAFEEQYPPENKKKPYEPMKPEETYSIILINYIIPKSSEDPHANFQQMRDASMPAASDAALFITMNKETVKYCFKLFNKWEFDIQSFAVISDEPTRYNMLLHGTRGKWTLPEEENQFACSIIQDKEGIYTAIDQLYPNIESRYEMGADSQHEGWGKSIESLQPKEEEPKAPTDSDDDDEPFESPFKNFTGRF